MPTVPLFFLLFSIAKSGVGGGSGPVSYGSPWGSWAFVGLIEIRPGRWEFLTY